MAVDFATFVKVAPHVAAVKKPILLRGRHGVGKSCVVYQTAAGLGLPVVERRASQMTEGDLVGLDIGDDGLVVASYSNGSQISLGKIVLVTFPSNEGLRQNGDSSYLSSAKSGTATFGEPGTAGFGTVRAGARERSNVDLTTELVGLITAQRNFQANAKAIETSSALTSTIINIRS